MANATTPLTTTVSYKSIILNASAPITNSSTVNYTAYNETEIVEVLDTKRIVEAEKPSVRVSCDNENQNLNPKTLMKVKVM